MQFPTCTQIPSVVAISVQALTHNQPWVGTKLEYYLIYDSTFADKRRKLDQRVKGPLVQNRESRSHNLQNLTLVMQDLDLRFLLPQHLPLIVS